MTNLEIVTWQKLSRLSFSVTGADGHPDAAPRSTVTPMWGDRVNSKTNSSSHLESDSTNKHANYFPLIAETIDVQLPPAPSQNLKNWRLIQNALKVFEDNSHRTWMSKMKQWSLIFIDLLCLIRPKCRTDNRLEKPLGLELMAVCWRCYCR